MKLAKLDAPDRRIDRKNEKVYGAYVKSIPNHAGGFICTLGEFTWVDIKPEKVEPVFAQLPQSVGNQKAGKDWKDRIDIAKKTGIGRFAMEFYPE